MLPRATRVFPSNTRDYHASRCRETNWHDGQISLKYVKWVLRERLTRQSRVSGSKTRGNNWNIVKTRDAVKNIKRIIYCLVIDAPLTSSMISCCLSGAGFAVHLIIFVVCLSVSFFVHRWPDTIEHTSSGRKVCFCGWPTWRHGKWP